MPRTDPSDTGGLFISRRPGTRPVKYGEPPVYAGDRRQKVDRGMAALILAVMIFLNLLFWGPIPMAWLWVGSQVQYLTDSVSLGILSAFAGLMATLFFGLAVLKRLDAAWIVVRRAGGADQRTGIIGPIFFVTCVVGTSLFTFWFLVIEGPGPSFSPGS